ncbi:MAG: DUF2384 domain-containing protein [Deltaproteobacteria bacterium]|nr:DUF2384 domain-containing protein [Deltaproteobacteria bacterium]
MRRKSPTLTDETLYEWDVELRELYLFLDHAFHSPPQIQNTDGDPLEFHRLIYEISSSAEEALEKLSGLCVTMTPEEIRQEAKQDASGRILKVEFSWDRLGQTMNQELPNTVLGHIAIKGRRLTAEVNSKQRADVFRREMDQRLGDLAHFKVDEIQDTTSAMKRMEKKIAGNERPDDSELMRDPEIREQMSEFLAQHWENWINEKIPALGGKTPKQAVKSADGREAVEVLLKEAERGLGPDAFTNEANVKGVSRVRELLGLKD